MNKKGAVLTSNNLTHSLIWAVIAGVIILIFLTGGGAKAVFDIGQFASKVPSWLWAIIVLFFIFRVFRGKK